VTWTTIRIFAILFVAQAMISGAFAETRVALVIGNSDYKHAASLPNPKNDAEDLALVLGRIGFSVTTADNLGSDAMRRMLRDFARQASRADMALVFFAGHGMEVNKQNYLIPTDAQLETDQDIGYEAVPLDLVINAVSGARRLGLVMLDACRNNPFAASMKRTSSTRSVGRGLTRIEPAAGTLVSYAAKEGTVADDGHGRNSPYTKALIAHLEQPGLEINFLFRKVRDSVLESTNGTQEPFTYGSLPGKQIFLKALETAPSAAVKPAPDGQGAVNPDALFWSSVKDSNDANMFQAYLDKFPDGLYAALAHTRLEQLHKQANASKPANQEDVFIGALDGTYVDEKSFSRIDADAGKDSVVFVSGNCAVYGKLQQRDTHWVVVATQTDGICAFLREISVDDDIARIFPTPGKMANSGRVLEFQVQHIAFVVRHFSGAYVLE